MLINANALAIPLANKSVHTIVTSPPYYGLRDYGTAKWEGGDPNCEHTVGSGDNDNLKGYVTRPERDGEKRQYCQLCGAIRIDEQIGLEVTPDAYIANLVEVFRECKRILRDDGTLWVNIGDSYTSMKSRYNQKAQNLNGGKPQDNEFQGNKTDLYHHPELGLKDKDLIGIPWMLAFALRADGWYLRQDIIWAKPNPMPESVKDRCTKSHEYIFLLSKSAKYYYDNEAIMEPSVDPKGTANRYKSPFMVGEKESNGGGRLNNAKNTAGYKNLKYDGQQPNTMHLNRLEGEEYMSPVRNKRDVWTVTTKPYKGAHYATFNPDLIKPCILAGAPEGGIVFDPFVGSGTTVATAIQLGRKGIGIDLSFKYLQENAKARVESAELPLLNFIEQ